MREKLGRAAHSPILWFSALAVLQGALFGRSELAHWTVPALAVFALLPLCCVFTGKTPRERLAGLAPCAAVWALMLLSLRFGFTSLAVLTALGAVLLFFAARLWKRGEMDWERAALFLLAAAVILRLAYVLVTPHTLRQHDLYGHRNYITWIVENDLRIPVLSMDPRSHSQFYHPPLHHLLSAIWVKLQMLFGADLEQGLESVQALALLWSNLALLFSYRLFKELDLRGSGLFAACAVSGFLPILIFGAVGINNDALLYMLEMALILSAVRWWRRPTAGRCALMGLLLGLCMETKLSGALLAVPLGVLFLAALIQRRAPAKALWGQYALFLLLSVSVGFAYSIYSLLRWGMPLNYVERFPETFEQYLSGYSALERLFGVSRAQLRNIYMNFMEPGIQDSNMFLTLLKSISFDDFTIISQGSRLWALQFLPLCLYLFVIAMALYALWRGARTVAGYVRRRSIPTTSGFLLLTVAVLMASYIQFCFAYPFVCTQHARYVLPIFPIAAACVGKGKAGRTRAVITVGLVLFSTLMFALLIGQTEWRLLTAA